jgi:hypothetical protein
MSAMRWLLFPWIAAFAAAVPAQPVQTIAESLADDAVQYAAQFRVTPLEALRRLKAQQSSVDATDAIALEFADRLAGISIEHMPEFRIVVLLTGNDPVADRASNGVPIVPAPRQLMPRRSPRFAST